MTTVKGTTLEVDKIVLLFFYQLAIFSFSPKTETGIKHHTVFLELFKLNLLASIFENLTPLVEKGEVN